MLFRSLRPRASCRMPGECRGADRGGLSISAVLKRHVPRCSGGGHGPAHPARCQGRHPQRRDRARPHRQPHPRAQSGRRPPAGQATDRGVWGGAELERAPAQPCPLGERAGCGRPPSPWGPGAPQRPVKVGDIVEVTVIEVDLKRNRISLNMVEK